MVADTASHRLVALYGNVIQHLTCAFSAFVQALLVAQILHPMSSGQQKFLTAGNICHLKRRISLGSGDGSGKRRRLGRKPTSVRISPAVALCAGKESCGPTRSNGGKYATPEQNHPPGISSIVNSW